jgi:uncharacterized protein (TIRG00374 family)
MRKHLTQAAQAGIFLSVGLIILYLLFRRQEKAFLADCALKGTPEGDCSLMDKIANDISSANYFWVVLTMILFLLSVLLRALRWNMMFRAIGYQPRTLNLYGTIMINYLANLGIPRSGEVFRAGLVQRYEDIPAETALGTIFTDRIFDVMMLALVLLLAIALGGNDFIAYLDQNIQLGSRLASLTSNPLWIVGVMLPVMIITGILWKNRKVWMSGKIGRKLVSLASGFAEGVQSVRKVSSPLLFIFYTVAIWSMYYLMTYLAFFAFAPTAHLGAISGLVVFVFGSLGVLIPTPGGMGSFHYLIGEALAMYGIQGTDAFSFANIVFFSIQIFMSIVFGLLSLVLLPVINKK